MSEFIFLFDLDSTITRQEILPTVAEEIGCAAEMQVLTEKTMNGELPFKQSFLERVEILKGVPVDRISKLISEIELNKDLIKFIQAHREKCFIVTGNLDVWIDKLMHSIGMEKNYFSSKAVVKAGYIDKVVSVVDKNAIISQFISPFVAVGDGNNDAEMIELADIGIGYGGVRKIAPSVLSCASHAIYREDVLCQFLERLL